jgi:hypothetical protein
MGDPLASGNACPRLRENRPNGLDTLELRLHDPIRFPEIYCALSVEPELGRIAKQARESESHRRAHGPTFPKQLVDCLARHGQRFGEAGHTEPIVGKEVLPEHLAGVCRSDLPISRVRYAHVAPRPSGCPVSRRRRRLRQRTESKCAILLVMSGGSHFDLPVAYSS